MYGVQRVVIASVSLAMLVAAPLSAAASESGDSFGEQQRAQWRSLVGGGLVVHLGCGDGRRTAELRFGGNYLVHGLDADAARVEAARQYLQSEGLYGSVSVDQLRGDRLPYIDNLVNLLVADDLGTITMPEVMRVMAPGGAAVIRDGQGMADARQTARRGTG
jgi:SAM-dependent methyltransferase